MSRRRASRRNFLKATAAVGVTAPFVFTHEGRAEDKNERLTVGSIGVGGRGSGIGHSAGGRGEMLACCDVDEGHAEKFATRYGGKCQTYEDYRKLLDRDDIDVVTIGTPDHWHTKIAIEAMQAGKDVYCEKPLTLTIDEGKLICRVAKDTKRVFQVGTRQRSEMANRFLIAVALAHSGRLGKIKKVSAAIGGGPSGGPFDKTDPPDALNWDMWLGQTPLVPYIRQRCHGSFRWWYEYSGGKMTDWGAHHVDIAQWAIGALDTGPISVEPIAAEHPVPFKDGYPTADDQFNTATGFLVRCKFAGGAEIDIRHDTDNGVLIDGEKGRIFANRGKLTGKPVEMLKEEPLPEDALVKLRKGKPVGGHMDNFFACVKDRSLPVSDVFTHHRALTTCHLANICIRLGRTLKWDPESEQIVGDEEANGFVAHEQRKGYEIKV